MKRYEQVLKSNITGYRGSVKRQDALKMMKEIAWQAWEERFTRTLNKQMKDTIFEGITPLVAQKFEFERWWNEELKENDK